MKKEIHPSNYRLVVFKDMSNEDIFITKSTIEAKDTIEIEGVEYPLVKLENLSYFSSLLYRKSEAYRHRWAYR